MAIGFLSFAVLLRLSLGGLNPNIVGGTSPPPLSLARINDKGEKDSQSVAAN